MAHLFLLEREVDRLALVEHLDAMGGVIGREQHTAVLQGLPLHLFVLRLNMGGQSASMSIEPGHCDGQPEDPSASQAILALDFIAYRHRRLSERLLSQKGQVKSTIWAGMLGNKLAEQDNQCKT